jgi:predicted RNase H-like nuclease
MPWVAGVDGCRDGWFVVFYEIETGETNHEFIEKFPDLLDLSKCPQVIAVDIPIGLLDAAEHGGRMCDREARKLLGPRASSVFPPPVRGAIQRGDYESANLTNQSSSPLKIGISLQAFGISKKIKEVNDMIIPILQDKIFEVHPELCFMEIAGYPMTHPKRTVEGYLERKKILTEFRDIIERLEEERPRNVAKDDILDACAACWTAIRIQSKPNHAVSIPANPPVDSRGLRMEMWR